MISLKQIWTKSIARQLMLGIALVHAVLMTIFVIDLVAREKNFLVDLSQKQAIGLAETLAANGTSWVLAQDFIGMEEIIQSQSGFPGLKYAMFLDKKGKVLAYTDINQVGNYVDDEISKTLFTAKPETYSLIDNSRFIDIATPILANKQLIGWARVGISREGITDNIQHVTRNGLIYTLAAIIIGTIFAWFMGRGLTMGLRHLSRATHGIAIGDRDVNCQLERQDELGVLSDDFNKMLTIINDKEMALNKSLSLLDALLDSVPDLVFYKDLDGVYIGCNLAFEELVNTPKKDLIGMTDYQLFPKDIADSFRDKDRLMLESGHSQQNEEWIDYPDGRRILVNTLKTPFYTAKGKLIGLIGIARDITLLKEQEEQLRSSRKMDALGKLTGGIAHDYNNMLSIILGFAELLEIKLADQPSLKKYARQIMTAGQRGASLTNKLLTFSRNTSENIERVDLNFAIQEASQMIEKSLTASIKVDLNLDKNLWFTQLDTSDFDNALINICINAMHAMDKEGFLRISTSNEHLTTEMARMLGVTPGDYVAVSISDTGVGMDDETISKIFDPFFSTKGEMGTGLGLSQVYGFLKRSKGTIRVHSKLGAGSTFKLYFPKDLTEEENNKKMSEHHLSPKITRQQTILVVDDEEALCELTQEILSNYGFSVLAASSGKEALNILQKESIGLLITDIIMPEIDGHQLATMARDIHPEIKVLFVSGYSDHTDSTAGDERIQKPINSADLVERVGKLLAE